MCAHQVHKIAAQVEHAISRREFEALQHRVRVLVSAQEAKVGPGTMMEMTLGDIFQAFQDVTAFCQHALWLPARSSNHEREAIRPEGTCLTLAASHWPACLDQLAYSYICPLAYV